MSCPALRTSLRYFCAAAICILAPMLGAKAAPALKQIYSFCKKTSCADGLAPNSGLVRDSAGNYYGTTLSGGAYNFGTVFRLTPNGTKYDFKVLHSFCAKPSCADGYGPVSSLIVDVNGNLYGMMPNNGPYGMGFIYELIRNASRDKYKFVMIYSFCAQGGVCPDGERPQSTLTYQGQQSGTDYDGTSPLYGATYEGGTGLAGAGGVIIRLNHVAGKTKRKEKVLYNFCSQANCADGLVPNGVLIDASGNLYGTTRNGGSNNDGVVFEASPKNKSYKETVLYNFCSQASCVDGREPLAPVVLDGSGNVIGTTWAGGDHDVGTVFKVVPNGVASTETVLYSFGSDSNWFDGAEPVAPVVIDSGGTIYGMTQDGGTNAVGGGTVFQIQGGVHSVLYSFCAQIVGNNCLDGAQPLAGVILDPSGNLFGTTSDGGANGRDGTVFEFKF